MAIMLRPTTTTTVTPTTRPTFVCPFESTKDERARIAETEETWQRGQQSPGTKKRDCVGGQLIEGQLVPTHKDWSKKHVGQHFPGATTSLWKDGHEGGGPQTIVVQLFASHSLEKQHCPIGFTRPNPALQPGGASQTTSVQFTAVGVQTGHWQEEDENETRLNSNLSLAQA